MCSIRIDEKGAEKSDGSLQPLNDFNSFSVATRKVVPGFFLSTGGRTSKTANDLEPSGSTTRKKVLSGFGHNKSSCLEVFQ